MDTNFYCILAVCKKQETAFGGGCFILDSRFRGNDKGRQDAGGTVRGNDKRISHLAKVIAISQNFTFYFGGKGGGVWANNDVSSATSPAGVHWAMP